MTGILADSITADMGFIPGLAVVTPLLGVPLSIVATVIERPFWTSAGLGRHAVWYSILANFVSLIVGVLIVVILPMMYPEIVKRIFLLWPFAAVFMSVVVERTYLN